MTVTAFLSGYFKQLTIRIEKKKHYTNAIALVINLIQSVQRFRLFQVFVLLFLLNSCDFEKDETPSIILDGNTLRNKQVSINWWRSTGPITIPENQLDGKKTIEYDFFEHWIGTSGLDEIQFGKLSNDIIKGRNIAGEIIQTYRDHITLGDSPKEGFVSANYLVCSIFSKQDQKVSFITGSNLKMKMWLNNDLIYRNEVTPLKDNQEIIGVHLKKGYNFVMLKAILEREFKFHFYLRLSSISDMKEDYIENIRHNFIDNPVLKGSDSLETVLNPLFFPEEKNITFQILDTKGRILLTKEHDIKLKNSISMVNISDGAYTLIAKIGGETLEQPLIYGNPSHFIGYSELKFQKFKTEEKLKTNFNALLTRYNVLNDFGNRNGFDLYLNRKIARACHSIAEIITKLEKKEEPIANVKGLHLRGYKSKIDDQVQHYQLYVPKGYDPEINIPLVVVTPWAALNKRPFLESWHVADLNRTEMLMGIADKYGYIILWPNSRIYDRFYQFPPIASLATFEVLGHIYKDYNVDKDKTYLYGACQGGGNALILANRYPSYFAALGVEGPDLFYGKQQINKGLLHPAIRYPQNFFNLPVYVMASDIDSKANLVYITALVDSIENHKGEVELDLLKGITRNREVDLFPYRRNIDRIFSFFKGKKLLKALDTLYFSTDETKYGHAYWINLKRKNSHKKPISLSAISRSADNVIDIYETNVGELEILLNELSEFNLDRSITIKVNGKIRYSGAHQDTLNLNLNNVPKNRLVKNSTVEGPINDIFSRRFILVESTVENANLNISKKKSIEGFLRYWNNNYYGDCIVKKDFEISDKDILESSLIIFGKGNNDTRLAQILEKLPIEVSSNHVQIKNKMYDVSNPTLSIIYPNPLNKEKYVLYLFSNTDFDFEAMDLAYNGLSDFMIWDSLNNLINKGNFNQFWEL